MPFIELPDERAANLPLVGLQRPILSQYQPFPYAEPRRLLVKAGYGSLNSPLADIYVVSKLGEPAIYSASFHHLSSESHLDRQPSSFRDTEISAQVQRKRKNHDLIEADLRVISRFNYLPAPEKADGTLASGDASSGDGGADSGDAGADGSSGGAGTGAERLQREGFRIQGTYTENDRSPLGWKVSTTWFGDRYQRPDLDGDAPLEAGGAVMASYTKAGKRIEEYQEALAHISGGSIRTPSGTTMQGVFRLSGGIRRLIEHGRSRDSNRSVGAEAGATGQSASGSSSERRSWTSDTPARFDAELKIHAGAAFVLDERDQNRFYPVLEAVYRRPVFRDIDLRATATALPTVVTVLDLREENRFYSVDDAPAHRYDMILRAGLLGSPMFGTDWSVDVSYGYTLNRPWFERIRLDVADGSADGSADGGSGGDDTGDAGDGTGDAGGDAGVDEHSVWGAYTVRFGEADEVGVSMDLLQRVVEGRLWVDVGFYVRKIRQKGGGKIPFTEAVGGSATVSWKPVNKVTLRPELLFLGARSHSEPGLKDLPAAFLMNLSGDVEIGRRISVFAALHHITGTAYERWDGFQERPFQAFGGVKLRW